MGLTGLTIEISKIFEKIFLKCLGYRSSRPAPRAATGGGSPARRPSDPATPTEISM